MPHFQFPNILEAPRPRSPTLPALKLACGSNSYIFRVNSRKVKEKSAIYYHVIFTIFYCRITEKCTKINLISKNFLIYTCLYLVVLKKIKFNMQLLQN